MFKAHTTAARGVEAGFQRDDVSHREDLITRGDEERSLGMAQADAVAGMMSKVLLEFALNESVTDSSEDLSTRDSGFETCRTRVERGQTGLLAARVIRAGGSTADKCTGEVAAIALQDDRKIHEN